MKKYLLFWTLSLSISISQDLDGQFIMSSETIEIDSIIVWVNSGEDSLIHRIEVFNNSMSEREFDRLTYIRDDYFFTLNSRFIAQFNSDWKRIVECTLYQDSDENWFFPSKTFLEYNANKQLTKEVSYAYNNENEIIYTRYLKAYSYADTLQTNYDEYCDDYSTSHNLKHIRHDTFEYNLDTTYRLWGDWNPALGEFEYENKLVTVNSDNYMVLKKYYWSELAYEWDKSLSRYTFYDDFSQIVEVSSYIHNGIDSIGNDRIEYTYRDDKLFSKTSFFWDESESIWSKFDSTVYYYDSIGRKAIDVLYKDNFNTWSSKTLYKWEGENQTNISKLIASSFKIYPNPAHEYIIISSTIDDFIEIHNIQGQVCTNAKLVPGDNLIHVFNLENGIYFFKSKNNGKSIPFIKY